MMMIILRAAEVEEGGEKDVCIKKRKKEEEEGEGKNRCRRPDGHQVHSKTTHLSFFFYLLRRR